ncbi:MAG: phage tail family protein [Sporichthyaceae bacterium]|nr:phage tail family protein [Sporichthyaceae bacterium]
MPVDTARLTIGSTIAMSGAHLDPLVDAYGVDWLLTKLDGWDDGYAAPDSGVTNRVSDHGGHVSDVFAVPRIVHVEGRLKAPSWDAATLAWERLMAAVPLSDQTTMTVAHGVAAVLPTKQAAVRQHEKPVISERVGGLLSYSLSLIAPDPRRYSTVLQTASTGLPFTTGGLSLPIALPISIGATVNSGRLSVVNDGNVASPPLLSITGPCPAPTITHLGSGRRLVVADAIDAGRVLTIDTVDQVALLDGTVLRTVTGSWWHLEPGVNQIAFTAPAFDAGALLTISFRSAWK